MKISDFDRSFASLTSKIYEIDLKVSSNYVLVKKSGNDFNISENEITVPSVSNFLKEVN